MYYQRIFAEIDEEGIVRNRIVCNDYSVANDIVRATYGEKAIAVECNRFAVEDGDLYIDGRFYKSDGETLVDYLPDVEELVDTLTRENKTLMRAAAFMAPSFTDKQALVVKSLYPKWETFINKSLYQGERVRCNNLLYKVRQDISAVLENQPPSVHTAALYEEIVENHAGTKDDPIPYNNNMELVENKYYTQDGILYLCINGSGQAVYNPLSELVGIYVEIVE